MLITATLLFFFIVNLHNLVKVDLDLDPVPDLDPDLDPHSEKLLDPDPLIMNADPQP